MNLPRAKEALKKYFGYDNFRPNQAEIIQTVLNKEDTLVIMPTGGGKSLCFQIPAIIQEGIGVVVSPLIALMKDQVEGLKANGIPAVFLNSSLSESQQRKAEDAINSGKVKLLYVSPEKLVTPWFMSFLKKLKINLFAIDEAHCISNWGHDFRPEYTKLKLLKHNFPKVPVIALTATADKLTRKDICKQLGFNYPKQFIASFDRPNLSLKVLPARNRYKAIIDFIDDRPNQSGIVYCLSRKSTESLAEKLQAAGINASYYHAGLTPEERSKTQEDFINDNIPIICATIAFGMGIDKSNVRWVIHYNLPKNIEGYYQEIGRAGRDGLKSDTLLFYSFADVTQLRQFIEEGALKDIQLAKLERMQQYAEARTCRRKVLLNYFNENRQENCGNCDVCKNPPKTFDGTVLAQKAISAIVRLNEDVPGSTLIDVLRGSNKQEILENKYNEIKTFGAGGDISYFDWQYFMLQFLNQGLIEIAYDQNHKVKLTRQSAKVLKGQLAVELVRPVGLKDKNQQKEPIARPQSKKMRMEEDLFDILRKLRKQLADKEGIPAYVILSDVSLREMASLRPDNKEELADISGVGEYKSRRYGGLFLKVIAQFKVREKDRGSTYLQTYELLKRGLSPEQIAQQRSLNSITVYSHIAHLYERDKAIEISRFISYDEINRIAEAARIVGHDKGLQPIYEHLNKSIDPGKIRLGLVHYSKYMMGN